MLLTNSAKLIRLVKIMSLIDRRQGAVVHAVPDALVRKVIDRCCVE